MSDKQCCSEILIDNQPITDVSDIVNAFNDCFVSMGPDLSARIPNVDGASIYETLGPSLYSSMFLSPVSDAEVLHTLKNLKNSSPGYDGILPI